MKTVDTGKEKVKKICEVLKKETLDPAKKEAHSILEEAKKEAEKMIDQGKKEAASYLEKAKKEIEEEKKTFQASLDLSCKKSLDMLKEEIENSLFNHQMNELFNEKMNDPHVIAELISAVIKGLEKDGIDANLQVTVPKAVPAKTVNQALMKGCLERIEGQSVQLGSITGGAEVKVKHKNLILDISDEAIKALVAGYVREGFRSVIFRA